jgi:uncharacterized SAM-binding protein YcdF (DUF218 family)
VVLGCRVLPGGRPSASLARRAAVAADAFHAGVAPLVVTSGGRRWGARSEARALADELVRRGVPRAAIVEELWSLSTMENALCSAALLRRIGRAGRPSAVLVTCAWHMPRALGDFRAAGLEPLALPSPVPAAGLLIRAWRRAHEIVCARLDRAAMRRARALRDGAAFASEPS